MKKRMKRIGLAAGLFVIACFMPKEELALTLFLAAYFVVGYKVMRKAVRNIANGQVFDENFLMAIASIGAFFVGEYPEAVAVMLFYQVGELFEDFAVGKSRKSISDLMNIRPDYANLIMEETGQVGLVDPEEVSVGQMILVKPGEKIPLDGVVREGSSLIDTAALTGESLPRTVEPGRAVLSGCINMNGLLRIEVTKPFEESTVSKILDLVENATMKKAKTENFITRFAGVYTPIVVIGAVLLAVIPPLVIPGAIFSDWLYRALNFLVVSCPCALVISVPLSFFGGIGGASKKGILVKGSSYLEMMSHARYVVLDKTGTLTRGVFEVEEIHVVGEEFTERQLLALASKAESYSSHPISASLKRAYGEENHLTDGVELVEEVAGHGVLAQVQGRRVVAGNQKLMEREGILEFKEAQGLGTMIYIAVDGRYAGFIRIADQLKEDTVVAVDELKRRKVKTVMLTGDSQEVAKQVAESLKIDSYYGELLPGEKVEKVEGLLDQLKKEGGKDKDGRSKEKLVFVGDGINDAPVLARADVGIAMGGLGSDAAIEAADIVLMNDEPSKLPLVIDISKKTMKIVKQNIVFALGIKILVLLLSTVGMANMWMAVFADVGVSMLAIMNSFRAMNGYE